VNEPRFVEVGRLGAAHGVRGWLRVQSFTDPPERLFEWKRWLLGSREVRVIEARRQGNGWIAQLEGVADRDVASRLTGQVVSVERTELPPVKEREHYREDLIGFEVRNLEGALFGVLDHYIDTPANAVMVIKGERERLVPVTATHLRNVDRDARTLTVDWPEDF
jgi:16S rRNA processing protein RimM